MLGRSVKRSRAAREGSAGSLDSPVELGSHGGGSVERSLCEVE